MFTLGDEIEFFDDSINDAGWVPPIRKGERFTVAGVFPVGTSLGHVYTLEPCIAIGRENADLRRYLHSVGRVLPHYDIWPAERFRKIERKRDRAALYALCGIDLPAVVRKTEAA